MLERILKELEEPCRPVTYPSGYYSKDGECVFVYNEDGEYVAERVDGLLTVFRVPIEGRIIGLQIKGVTPGEVLSVGVQQMISKKRGVRIDVVVLLLRSFKRETQEEPDREQERERLYQEAMASILGCKQLEVDLQEAACEN